MGNKVAQQIVEEAKRQAAEILARAEEDAAVIEKARREKAERKAELITNDGEAQARELRNQILAAARIAVKQAEVEKKRELIDAIFEDAKKDLAKVPLSEVLPKHATGQVLRVSKKDLAWAKKNFGGHVIESDILGGYILETGGVIENNSFDLLLSEMRDRFSSKILKAIK